MTGSAPVPPLAIAIGAIAGVCVLAFCSAILCEQAGNCLQRRRERYERGPF